MIINGNDLTWEQGTISSSGGKSSSTAFIRTSDFLAVGGGQRLTYITPIQNANDEHYSAFVCQYSSNTDASFIQRDVLLKTDGATGETVQLASNCAYVKFLLGHPAAMGVNTTTTEGANVQIQAESLGMSLRSRRRVLMATNFGSTSFSFEDFITYPAVELGDITILAEDVRQSVFMGAKMGAVNAPNLTWVRDGVFNSAKITSLYAPNVYSLGGNCLQSVTGLQYAVFPKLRVMYSNALNNTSTIAADFGGTPESGEGLIRTTGFGANFGTLVLRSNTMWPLTNVNTFNGSKFASGKAGGILYVPSALISAYQGDSVWGTLLGYTNNSIQSIEGSAYATQYVDGTPISS